MPQICSYYLRQLGREADHSLEAACGDFSIESLEFLNSEYDRLDEEDPPCDLCATCLERAALYATDPGPPDWFFDGHDCDPTIMMQVDGGVVFVHPIA